jgi:hypothetical protein
MVGANQGHFVPRWSRRRVHLTPEPWASPSGTSSTPRWRSSFDFAERNPADATVPTFGPDSDGATRLNPGNRPWGDLGVDHRLSHRHAQQGARRAALLAVDYAHRTFQ